MSINPPGPPHERPRGRGRAERSGGNGWGLGKRLAVIAGGVVVALLLAAGISVLVLLHHNVPDSYTNIRQEFEYGSIGAEARSGVPYWIWVVLPKVFPQDLPADVPGTGYEKLGFHYEPGNSRPVGTSYRSDPIGMVGVNCAVCHTGTIQSSPTSTVALVLGEGSNTFNLQGYIDFLRKAGQDPRFNADVLLAAIRRMDPKFSWIEAEAYRYYVIPKTRTALKTLNTQFSWMDSRPAFGPGRVDTFDPYKVLLGVPLGNSIGTVKLPSIWDQEERIGMSLHWDGNNDSLQERDKSAAIGAGATPDSLDLATMTRIENWIKTGLKPPGFPTSLINPALAAQGAIVYQANCASCHAIGGADVGKVTPISEVGTDPERLNDFTPQLAKKMNTIAAGKPFAFSHFVKTDGYANMPLDGIWARGPYLHNGSVPTLRDLLNPPSQRPTTFYVGYDVYDYNDLGYVSSGPGAAANGFEFNTALPGNSNEGHLYGTNLPQAEKDALLEYLKTL